MNFLAMGIFVNENNIALIWDQNELSHKSRWEIEKNGERMSAIYSVAIAALRQERL